MIFVIVILILILHFGGFTMGRCYACGQPVPGDIQMQLCENCKRKQSEKQAQNLNKVVYARAKFYCSGCGKLIRQSDSARISVSPSMKTDADGYYHVYEYCSDCAVETAKKTVKTSGKFLKFIIVIFIIGAVVYGGGKLFNKGVLGTNSLVQKAFDKKISAFESDGSVIKNVEDENAPGVTVIGFLHDSIDTDDYHVYFYNDSGKAEVQKSTNAMGTDYCFSFDKGFGETLGGKKFAMDSQYIYDVDEKIAYASSSSEYAQLNELLNAYFPENVCAKRKFNRQDTMKTDNDAYIDVLYGDDATVYIDWSDGKYYEKSDDSFIYVTFSESGKGHDNMSKPKISDCTVVD